MAISQATKDTALARVLMVHGEMFSKETRDRCAALLDMLLETQVGYRWYHEARETIESFGLIVVYPGEHGSDHHQVL